MFKLSLPDGPFAIEIASILIGVAVFSTLLAYISMLIYRLKGYVGQKRADNTIPLVDNLLLEKVLLHPQINTEIPKVEMVELAKSFDIKELNPGWAKHLLIARLVNYRKNVRGNIGNAIRSLFIQLELDSVCLKMLRSRKWYKKAKALYILVEMEIVIPDVTLLPLTNSHNHHLRSAARLAYIKLSKNDPFKFFDVVTEPLLQWDQVELFRVITSSENFSMPNFARWITYSSNKSVVSFCLKLVVHYMQLEAVPAVIRLLDNKDHFLRANAINALGKMDVDEVADQLLHMYHNQPIICQTEILKALGRFRNQQAKEFLKREFLHSNDFNLRKHAARSLINILSKEDVLIKELMNNATKESLMILKHCMDPLIKF
ncbi:HEAT repeat domain-containing protein [Olivibacter domesticus]|uniref:HEAT repeat-containing protein n=1 Tax=Olivibacter domesticus TaxID=407022 RepID=A0A1H7KWD4_OLID1|nr:HEAT repeat domain-containing protein [Olivibacter domesticus]SEK91141.1 hypothetical protein SAMN05661044_01487 [Olivibacter domesticus]